MLPYPPEISSFVNSAIFSPELEEVFIGKEKIKSCMESTAGKVRDICDLIDILSIFSELPYRPEKTLRVFDFDDTLYARLQSLSQNIFQDNRGEKGNTVLLEEYGLEKYIDAFYRPEGLEPVLELLLRENDLRIHSMILTAGIPKIQKAKLLATGLSDFTEKTRIVTSGHDKPMELIDYILGLGYIPGVMEVYEDRIQDFEQQIGILRMLLPQTEIRILEVSLGHPKNHAWLKDVSVSVYQSPIQSLYHLPKFNGPKNGLLPKAA